MNTTTHAAEEPIHGYGELHAPTYDACWANHDDADMVADLLHGLARGERAIEFGVGTGRLALPLARRGTPVVAIDNSPAMLDILRRKLHSEPDLPVELRQADLVEARVDGPAGLVYCVFSTLFLLRDQDAQIACLENAAWHLKPGGRMLIECFVHDRTRFPDNQEVRALDVSDAGATFRLATLSPNDQIVRVQRIGLGRAGIEFTPNRLRFVYPAELDLIARIAGFKRTARWGGWDRQPFTATSGLLVAVFEKL